MNAALTPSINPLEEYVAPAMVSTPSRFLSALSNFERKAGAMACAHFADDFACVGLCSWFG